MQYADIRSTDESQDPSLTIETAELVAKVIDNTELTCRRNEATRSRFGRYGTNNPLPSSHHLGYHGIRTLYHKEERRNLVVPLVSWLNLQNMALAGIENDPVDERAWSGLGRGWPIRLESVGAGARLTIEPMPVMQFRYSLELQPAQPDGIDFSVRFVLNRKPNAGPARLRASWPCYMNAYDDVRFFYPKRDGVNGWTWCSLGEPPDIVIGEAVGYDHDQMGYVAEEQAMPVGYGRIGERVLILMFDDPGVRLFVVNAGGHMPFSPVQNPAWDFEWEVSDYPVGEEIGFDGRIVYRRIEQPDDAIGLYERWVARGAPTG